MRHAGHHDPPQDYDLGSEATQIFPALGPDQQRQERRATDPLGQTRVRPQPWDQGRPHPPRRTRLSNWVIAAGCFTGAIAAYVAFATAGVPARPMPSPFAPVNSQSSQSSPGGSQASRLPGNCATPLPGPRSAMPAGPLVRGAAAAPAPGATAGPQVVQELAR
jgi:hypothetical protein